MTAFTQPNAHAIAWSERLQTMYPGQISAISNAYAIRFQAMSLGEISKKRGRIFYRTVPCIVLSTRQNNDIHAHHLIFKIFTDGKMSALLHQEGNDNVDYMVWSTHSEAECLQYIRHYMEHLLPKTRHEYLTSIAREATYCI